MRVLLYFRVQVMPDGPSHAFKNLALRRTGALVRQRKVPISTRCAQQNANMHGSTVCRRWQERGDGRWGLESTLLVLASLLTLKRTSDLTLPAWAKTSVRAASSVVRGILAKKICRPECWLGR